MTRKRILVLEDDPKSLYALQSILENHGYQVSAFSNAEDARHAPANEVDAAIIDVRLPKQNGVDFARELLQRNEAIKIIFVTAFDDLEHPQSRPAGVFLLAKPIDMQALLQLL